MRDIRTNVENDENIKKVNDVLVFEALRSYNINNSNKLLLKGGRLYNLLTGDKSSFDIDVQYNKKNGTLSDLEELAEFFSKYFKKKMEIFKYYFFYFCEKITVSSIISKINIGNLYVLKFSYCLNDTLYIPFFEITCSNFVTNYWEYSYGIYCILPSQLILNLMDMASQYYFHKSDQCKKRLDKMIETRYLKDYFNMDENTYVNERMFKRDIPKNCSVMMRSYEELINEGYSLAKIGEVQDKLKSLGVLEKYLFLKDGKITFHYRLKEYEKFIEIFEDARDVKEGEYLEKYQKSRNTYMRMLSENNVLKFFDLTMTNLLETDIFYLKYSSSVRVEKIFDMRKIRKLTKKIISPIVILSPLLKINKIYKYNDVLNFNQLVENETYRIKTKFKKSIDGNDEIKINRNCLGVEPTLCVIFPNINRHNNITELDDQEIFNSEITCVKKRKVYFKTSIDKKVLIEPMNLIIFRESP